MLVNDGGGGGTYKPPPEASKSTSSSPQQSTVKASPEFRAFVERQQRTAMLANNQWKPMDPQQPDDTWSKMPQDQRDNLNLLPTHTFTMTEFETDRLRKTQGKDFPAAPAGASWTPTTAGSYQVPGGLLTTDSPPDGVERIADPAYSQSLTWEEYDKLSDADRAVVDFNGDFLEARAKDFENKKVYEKTATPEQKAKYDEDLANIFGGRGGSETYAPNVLSLLKSVDFDAVGQDLDEYLNLDRLVTADEMDILKDTTKPRDYGSYIGPSTAIDEVTYKEIRQPENLAAIDRVLTEQYAAQITKVMEDGYLRLKDVQASMESSRSAQTLGYGGVGYNAPVTPGFPVVVTPGSPEATTEPQLLSKDQQMGLMRRGVYEFAIDKKNKDSSPMFQWLTENKFTEADRSSLWEYVRERLAQDKEYGVPDMIQKNIPERRTYDETEKFLGMEAER